jgi:exonuclease SbcC
LRPIHLAVEGLACFRDRQQIDFRGLELFAISGPTGAGKSTLLDAMIFALYGEIPRVSLQGRTEMISAPRDRVTVVLDFEVGESRYRVARTLRRNGVQMVRLEQRGEDGEFQGLADQVRTAADRIVQVLGLGASAFMQAVVLPQGEFARFLKAPPRDRRSMLRTLLRLDVYERMREHAQRLSVQKRAAVDSLRSVLLGEYAGVDAAAVAKLAAEHARVVSSLTSSRERRDKVQAELARVQSLHAKTRELRQVEARQTALRREAMQVRKDQERIEAAARAAPLLPLLDEAARAFAVAQTATQAATEAKSRKDAAHREWQEKAAAQRAAEKGAGTIKTLRAQVARLHQVVGRLPERQQLEATLELHTRALDALDAERSALVDRVASARAAQAQQAAAVEAARQAAEASGYDQALDDLLQSERDRAVELGASRRLSAERSAELRRKRQAVKAHAVEVERRKRQAASAKRSASKAQRALDAAEEERRRAVTLNEANHLRRELVPGEPCPVCEQIVDVAPEVRGAPELAAASAAVQDARNQRAAAEALARQGEAALAGEEAKLLVARQGLSELEARHDELSAAVAAGEDAILRAFGDRAPQGGGVVEAWIERQIVALARSRRLNVEAQEQRGAAERALERGAAEEAAARERLGERETRRRQLADERSATRKRLTALNAQIRAVTRSADPAAEVAGLEERIQQAEARLKAASEEAAGAQNRLAAAEEAHRFTAEAAKAALDDALRRVESRDAEIERAGFAGETAVRGVLLDETVAEQLRRQIQRHLQDIHTVEERHAALVAELGDERVSDRQLAAIERVAAELTAKVEAALGQGKRLEEQIERLKERLERLQQLRDELTREVAALQVHEVLAADLRSDRFQAYLLQEVFTDLVRGASARLLTLTSERYSLRFHDDEIRVVDHDNADETRISDTLSGGETFLTSLALALELSDQVQRAVGAVNLDSLFIDEGFGTLDPDTLALVSETLQELLVGGRMVGVITHIPELRDEFAQQIIVVKHQGYSTVEVHGLTHRAADESPRRTRRPSSRR